MRQALADSQENLMDYVKQNMPWFYDQIKQVLESKGEDVLLPALRIIEAGLLEPDT